MAAVLKKRALAEYSQVIEEQPRPIKRLRLVRKPSSSNSTILYVGLLERQKTSNEALQVLLRISDSLQFQEDDFLDIIKKLTEHFKREKESAVRVKILSLFGDIGCEAGADIQHLLQETQQLLKEETSHKVIVQGVTTLLRLGKLIPDNIQVQTKLVLSAKQYLKDTSHAVKSRCLELIGQLLPVVDSAQSALVQTMLRLIGDYTYSQDARVRAAAFKTMINLHDRGLKLDPSIYTEVCSSLKDDYEIVRLAALRLICVLGNTYAENIIVLPDSEGEELRLVDDAFAKICSSVTDLSLRVRTIACQLLGTMHKVSPKFLEQTLDKKLMSNMRVGSFKIETNFFNLRKDDALKRSAHERALESVRTGEWSSGKKWADDAPREKIDKDSISLVTSGSCGAFVHGLEDEFLEVRSAAVDALCLLSLDNHRFAVMSLDYLVDMFNDEIEDVRIKAIDSLTRISKHIILRDDQLETILSALEDFSMDVREGLHKMLAACRLSTKSCLQMCVEALLDNLKKYPQDRRSLWRCFQRIGSMHPELTLPLVPELLNIHPFFDMPEHDVEDPAYICILILVFNAAQQSPTMLQLFEENTLKHYSYLRDTMPHLVPVLKLGINVRAQELASVETNTSDFIQQIFSQLAAAPKATLRSELMEAAQRDLSRLAAIDSAVSGAAEFTALFIGSQLLMEQVLSNRLWSNPASLATQQGNIIRTSITTLLQNCLKLQHMFMGLRSTELAAVKQFKLKALALQLVYIVTGSNSSALSLCDHFLLQVEETQKFLSDESLNVELFTSHLFKEMAQLEETKPGPVARCVLKLLQTSSLALPPHPNISIHMLSADITEPQGDADNAYKFTAGMVIGIPLDADIRNLRDTSILRVKLKYPDQQTVLIIPRTSDLRQMDGDDALESSSGEQCPCYRLLTTVLVSHQVWSEAMHVDISLALDVTEGEGGLGISSTARRAAAQNQGDPCVIDICKPVKVFVSPRPIKRGI
ncbi:Integrator complex subunit 4 [Frankliniella fusca]|uniref:Integrator complex subunit 4 n=1 Tax=Frankliniella fusca TaxID=407009 RepID=A0AAE1L7D1_9NEOP|nr:Integrator complex subunit 4 [Frankliniella fusca]